ncbi:MAG: sigma factor-like helix-turn-helix DNA-binding protein [Candidatus Doudnabacteria bacterium]|nr:sigma factor-like helix-turn-helix DNA-binding protein [Candidatus Doudnabacteria bacterium]
MTENEILENANILQRVMGSQQKTALRDFDPQQLVLEHLKVLGDREIQILLSRHGLNDGQEQTLEFIGKRLNLTRERVRQIEKDSFKKLKKNPFSEGLGKGIDLIFQILEGHGSIMRETDLLNVTVPQGNDVTRHSILFLLNLSPSFIPHKESHEIYRSWSLAAFDRENFGKIIVSTRELIEAAKKPLPANRLFGLLRSKNVLPTDRLFTDESLESIIEVSKSFDKNPFNEWGLGTWLEIHPKDVGDKAFLVLEHHGKPEHYSKITELINKQKFDDRTAHMETVHNELIRDGRFVLIGRGIYALKKWGYEKGTVGDVIEAILKKSQRPLAREEIITEVLKHRIAKKNTIIVGLADKKRFQKTQENKYLLSHNA